jgi:hypothetical protein
MGVLFRKVAITPYAGFLRSLMRAKKMRIGSFCPIEQKIDIVIGLGACQRRKK